MSEEFSYATAFLVFLTYVAIDVLYAMYIASVSKRRPFTAAVISCAIYSLLAYGILTYSHNPMYLMPLACGAFVGTFFTVWMQK